MAPSSGLLERLWKGRPQTGVNMIAMGLGMGFAETVDNFLIPVAIYGEATIKEGEL